MVSIAYTCACTCTVYTRSYTGLGFFGRGWRFRRWKKYRETPAMDARGVVGEVFEIGQVRYLCYNEYMYIYSSIKNFTNLHEFSRESKVRSSLGPLLDSSDIC